MPAQNGISLHQKIELIGALQNEERFFISSGAGKTIVYDSNSGKMHIFSHSEGVLLKSAGAILASTLTHNEYATPHFFNRLAHIIATPNAGSVLETEDKNAVKINLGTVCNLSCTYCFRNKENRTPTNVSQAKRIIDAVITKYNPHADHYSFTFNMTSEPLLELEKLKEIKAYLDQKYPVAFRERDFESPNQAMYMLSCLPAEYSARIQSSPTIAEIVDSLNAALSDRELSKKIPLLKPLSPAQAEQYAQAQNLAGQDLQVFNRRHLETVFPTVFQKKPYTVFYFISNGTLFTNAAIAFIKQLNINPFCISLDGPKTVHDRHRRFEDGRPTFDIIEQNVQHLKKNGIAFIVSAVITKEFPNPLELAAFFLDFGAQTVTMNPVRQGTPDSFTKETLPTLLDGYKRLYKRLQADFCAGNKALFTLLQNDMTFTPVKLLLTRHRFLRRCKWNEDIIIDADGGIYPCDSVLGIENFKRGTIEDFELTDVFNERTSVDDRPGCKNCWARYLCGGTCYVSAWHTTGTIYKNDEVECTFNKALRVMALDFVRELLDAGADIQRLMDWLGIRDAGIELNKTVTFDFALSTTVRATLSGLAVELTKIRTFLTEQNLTVGDTILLTVRNTITVQGEDVLDMRIIVPTSGIFPAHVQYTSVQDFSLGATLSAVSPSDDASMEETERYMASVIQSRGIPISGTAWYLAPQKVLLGQKTGTTVILYQRNNDIL